MKGIPKWIQERIRRTKVQQLPALTLSGGLRFIPDEIFELSWLETLDLGNNHLTFIPDEISKLKNLHTLYLYRNDLTNLPSSIAQLTNLAYLDLSKNKLTSIPNTITNLTSLCTLNLRYNQLTTVPNAISYLKNLYTLNFSFNQLVDLPVWLVNLPHLTTLYLRGNFIETPPPEILERQNRESVDLDKLRAYFRQLTEVGDERLFEAKLLIVGDAGAGKTSLAHKIIDPTYQLNPNEPSTEGIDVYTWEFPIALESIGDNKRLTQSTNNKFRVNLWDFGGQEIYYTTHQFFLSRRSLYIVVADAREQKMNFSYWLDSIELLSDGSPVLILSNEKQDRQWDVNERQLRSHFSNIKDDIFTANLQTNRGLDRLRGAIRYHVAHLPHVGDVLPITWVNVRRTLESESKPYITREQFFDLCQQNGVTQLEDKLQLSRYLHDLGVCLHFQDDALLNKIVILQPEWVTDAVYRLLDDNTVKTSLGEFNRSDLYRIWHEETYVIMQDELLALMMKFQLCYEIPTQADTYIAPQLLSESQPSYSWPLKDNLSLRYKYDAFMPQGIITRLIVIMHPYIAEQKRVWRNGVVLLKDNTEAEIIEDSHRREIRIRVTGLYKRDLLTIIIHELDNLHLPFKGIKYDKLIPCNCLTCRQETEPHFFQLEVLKTRLAHNKESIECDQPPFHSVSIWGLIDDVDARGQIIIEDEYLPLPKRPKLLSELEGAFDEEEIRTFCFDLDIDYDDLPAQGRINKMRELISRMEREGRLAELVKLARKKRPHRFT